MEDKTAQMPAIGNVSFFRRNWTAVVLGLWYAAWLVVGVWLILRATPWGIGVRHDSLAYVTAAENLAQARCLCWTGSGLVLKPLVHFGPLYPSLVAAVASLTGGALAAARWVDALLYGANLALAGFLIHHATRRVWAGAFVSASFLLSPVILQVHDAAMSEPLFLLFFLIGVFALTAFLESGKTAHRMLSSLAAAAAILTRYAGSSFLVAAVPAIVLLGSGGLRRRIGDALVFAGTALAPVFVWLARNYIVAGTPTNRVLRAHVVDVDDARQFLDVITKWFGPNLFSHWLEGAVLASLLVGLAALFGRARRSRVPRAALAPTMGLLLVFFVVAYSLTIAFSKSLFDDSIPIDNRMLSPLHVSLGLIVALAAGAASYHRRFAWVAVLLGALLLAGPVRYMGTEALGVYRSMQADGVGFTSRAWQRSGSLSWIRTLPSEAVVYSKRALMIQFHTGHAAYQVPEGYDSVKAEARTDFEEQLARMRFDLSRPGNYLVIFDPTRPVESLTIPDDFTEGLEVFLKTADGVVFRRSSSGAGPGNSAP